MSIYCEMFREILLAVFKASLERPEGTNFLVTLARFLALRDDAPQSAGNPMSTRYHWRGPMHTAICAELQREVPGAEHYQVYPQPPRRPRVDLSQFQRAMLAHISSSVDTSTITTPAASTFTASTRERSREFDSDDVSQCTEAELSINVDSDTDSVDTTAAVVFTPAAKLIKRLTANKEETTSACPLTSHKENLKKVGDVKR